MTTIVLGGGYAGVTAANRLAAHGMRVRLVTPRDWFVERIRLHVVASGARDHARVPLEALLDPRVDLVLDAALRIRTMRVELASGHELPFARLVYAVGSGAARPGPAHRITEETGAAALRAELAARPEAPVTIAGAGLTGVELAGALALAGRRVRLVSASSPPRGAARDLLVALARRGVEVRTGTRVELSVPHAEEILVDTTGFAVPDLAAISGLPVDSRGRLRVGPSLEVPGRPDLLGAGDAVLVEGPGATHLRPACASAMPLGAHAADVVLARNEGRSPAPFSLGYAARCVDLGAGHGHVQLVRADDSERAIAVTGRAGGLLKEAVCRLTLRWMSRAASYSWPRGPEVPAGVEVLAR